MTDLRGFGFTLDTTTGRVRNWYVGADGVKRWADDDSAAEPIVPEEPKA